MSWYNNDGLYVRFGTEKTVPALIGEDSVSGQVRSVVIDFDFADLATFGTAKIFDGVVIPSGVVLKSATLEVIVGFDSGTTATMDIGLIDSDRTTAWNATGIDAAIAETAIAAAGSVVSCDGALIGTTLSNSVPGYVIITLGTANYTVGAGRLTIEYFHPAA